MLTCRQIEQIINQHRIHHKIRVLWPDYEVYDLLEENINLDDIRFFTSNCISIVKIDNITHQLASAFSDKALTHLAVHRGSQFNKDMQIVDAFYAILSKRGLAVDQLICKFQRGIYHICAHVAQIDRQISLWGVQSVTEEIKLVGPKSIVKKNTMWTVQFESPKPVKSILLYSTKREPRYGKSSFVDSELPKDSKLQFCMKTKIFQSYLDSLMNKQEPLISDIFYLSPIMHKSIKFSKQKKQEGQQGNQQFSKIKLHEDIPTKLSQAPIKTQQRMVKILSNSSFLQVLNTTQPSSTIALIQQIKQYISKAEQTIHQLITENTEDRQIITSISFKEIQCYSWGEIIKLTDVAKQTQTKSLYHFLFAASIFIFCRNESRSIYHWIQIYQQAQMIEDAQLQWKFRQWSKMLMIHYCLHLLKHCEDQVYEQLMHWQYFLIDCLTLALQQHQHENAKRSDLLYILMQIHKKRDIIDLYLQYRQTPHPLLLASSLRNLQLSQQFLTQSNSDLIYQASILPQIISYNPTVQPSLKTAHKSKDFDFEIKFISDLSYNNALISGKIFTVNNISFKYFIFRQHDDFYYFVERLHPYNQSPTQSQFHTYQISIEMTIKGEALTKQISWSFISPSIAVGAKFSFKYLPSNISLTCKMSFRRNIVHDSILNYLRIRFEELVGLQNKCSFKIEQENKKLAKRRSSVFLQNNILINDFHEKIERQCFLHKYCHKCQNLSGHASIYHLSAFDFYSLLLCAPFKQQLDAFLITIKYLIINQCQQINKYFWMSQIRIKYLNLHSLLKLINNIQDRKNTVQICGSLIDQKIKQSILVENRKDREAVFVMLNQSRIGITMWQFCQQDYSSEYLTYITNNNSKI